MGERQPVTLELSLTAGELDMLLEITQAGGFKTLEATALAGMWRLGRFQGIDVPPHMFDVAKAARRRKTEAL